MILRMCATREDLVGADQAKKDCELEGFDTLTDSQKSVVTRSLRHKRPVELVAQVTAGLEELSVVN